MCFCSLFVGVFTKADTYSQGSSTGYFLRSHLLRDTRYLLQLLLLGRQEREFVPRDQDLQSRTRVLVEQDCKYGDEK